MSQAIASSPGDDLARELVALQRRIDALQLRFSRLSAEYARTRHWEETGSVSPIDWIRFNCHLTSNAAAERVAVGERTPQLSRGIELVERGELGFAHVSVMARAAATLGERFDERDLIELAREQSPGKFHYTCLHYRHAADPQGFAAEQAQQAENRRLSLSTWEDGSVLVNGILDSIGGATVRTALEPLARRTGAHDHRVRDHRLADALIELASGAEQPARIQVSSSLETLVGLAGSPAAEMEFAPPISSETARRLACDSSIARVLLDQESLVIDVGRAKRVVSAPVRRALNARDRHCTWPACDRPASWSAAHHVVHWTHGGKTDLDNLVLLCHRHHWMVHEGGWQLVKTDEDCIATVPPTVRFGPGGRLEVVAPDRGQVVEDPHSEGDDRSDREVHPELVAEVHQAGGERHVGEQAAEEDAWLERPRDVRLERSEDRVERGEQRDGGVARVGDGDGDR